MSPLGRGLKYEKGNQEPPFQTWAQVEQQVARGGLAPQEVDELWDARFLDPQQIAECLDHVQAASAPPFVYPLFVFVAHTGARRGAMIRSRSLATALRWKGIESIQSTDDHAYFFTVPKVGLNVPRRAFGSPDDFVRFLARAQEYRRVARLNLPSVLPADSEEAPGA